MQKPEILIALSYLVVFTAGFAVRSLVSWRRRRRAIEE